MYGDWTEIDLSERSHEESSSVLSQFSSGTGKAVAAGIARELAHSVSTETAPVPVSADKEDRTASVRLETDQHVRWAMQVLRS